MNRPIRSTNYIAACSLSSSTVFELNSTSKNFRACGSIPASPNSIQGSEWINTSLDEYLKLSIVSLDYIKMKEMNPKRAAGANVINPPTAQILETQLGSTGGPGQKKRCLRQKVPCKAPCPDCSSRLISQECHWRHLHARPKPETILLSD